jgi:hypothetical protein
MTQEIMELLRRIDGLEKRVIDLESTVYLFTSELEHKSRDTFKDYILGQTAWHWTEGEVIVYQVTEKNIFWCITSRPGWREVTNFDGRITSTDLLPVVWKNKPEILERK